jgi:cold-inducible RNA-binding protein
MAKKLYVGGVPFKSTEDELKAAFEKAGPVMAARIITDRMTGRSRGFAFVEMADDAGANAAIKMWNGQDFGGRRLIVSEARPDRPRE